MSVVLRLFKSKYLPRVMRNMAVEFVVQLLKSVFNQLQIKENDEKTISKTFDY